MSPRDVIASHMTVPFRRPVVVSPFMPVSIPAAIAVVPIIVPVVSVVPFLVAAIVVAVVPTLIRVGTWRDSYKEDDSEANGDSDVHGILHPIVWMEGFQGSYRWRPVPNDAASKGLGRWNGPLNRPQNWTMRRAIPTFVGPPTKFGHRVGSGLACDVCREFCSFCFEGDYLRALDNRQAEISNQQ